MGMIIFYILAKKNLDLLWHHCYSSHNFLPLFDLQLSNTKVLLALIVDTKNTRPFSAQAIKGKARFTSLRHTAALFF